MVNSAHFTLAIYEKLLVHEPCLALSCGASMARLGPYSLEQLQMAQNKSLNRQKPWTSYLVQSCLLIESGEQWEIANGQLIMFDTV